MEPLAALGDRYQQADVPMLAGLPGLAAVKKFIRAFHGSPHDFEKFDPAKIGTGEGNQAFGHGLYFAGNEDVARGYREALTRDKDRELESGGKLPSWVASKLESRNPIAIEDVRKDFQGRLAEMHRQLADPNTMQPWNIEANIPGIENILKSIDQYAGGAQLKPPGRMYEVGINADPKSFLDWDKPLKDQPIAGQLPSSYLDATKKEAYIRALASTSKPRADELWSMVKDPLNAPGGFGIEARKYLSAPETSGALNEAGIPGIKYLDAGSRGGGEGTSNYVVFPGSANLIDIMRKYGLAGMVGAGAAAENIPVPAPK